MYYRILTSIAAIVAAALPLATPTYADEAVEAEVETKVEAKQTDRLFGADLGVDLPWARIGTDTVVYEAPRYGADARLFVLNKNNDTPRWRVYRGPAYQRIVKDNPDLGTHASLNLFGLKIGAKAGVKVDQPTVATHRPGMQYYVTAPGMTYESASFDNRSRLYVMENGGEYVYVGNDLDAIAKRYPHITKMKSYPELRKRALDRPVTWRTAPRTNGRSHIQVWRSGDEYTVRTWTYSDGSWDARAYQGESLAAIANDNPEAAKHLRIWTDAKWSTPSERSSAIIAGAKLATAMRDGKPVVVVENVEDATFASTVMLKPGDEIVSIGGKRVTSLDMARLNMASAARSASTDIEVRRDGKTVKLATSTKTAKRTP